MSESARPSSHSTGRTASPMAVFAVFLAVGTRAFGGPAAQISALSTEFIHERQWISVERFRRALAVCQILPGPEAHEMCCYLGVLRSGRIGGVMAGLGFMLPGLVLMLIASIAYDSVNLREPAIAGAMIAMQVAATALIVRATVRLAHTLAAGRLLACTLIIAMCVTLAWSMLGTTRVDHIEHSARAVSVPELFGHGLVAGLVSFGGAYTSIPYVAGIACGPNGWMSEAEFLDGVALAGVLPAPLVIFGTFVGYQGHGVWGALAFTAGIFLPAFTFIVAGFRVLERVIASSRVRLLLDLAGATAVGVIAATAIGLALRSVFAFDVASFARGTIAPLPSDTALRAILFIVLMTYFFRIKGRFAVPLAMLSAAMIGAGFGACSLLAADMNPQ